MQAGGTDQQSSGIDSRIWRLPSRGLTIAVICDVRHVVASSMPQGLVCQPSEAHLSAAGLAQVAVLLDLKLQNRTNFNTCTQSHAGSPNS